MTMVDAGEALACSPRLLDGAGFNPAVNLPCGLTTEHILLAMNDFIDFLGFINQQLHTRGMPRLESTLMPANFSSLVGEFMVLGITKHCPGLAKNRYHNGYPDMIPEGRFPGNAVQYGDVGIEVKASRYPRGWQGHNAENGWLMVFVFDSNRPDDPAKGVPPKPLRFIKVVTAPLTQVDWKFAGRSETSRRTITASVTPSGYEKMMANWVYQAPEM